MRIGYFLFTILFTCVAAHTQGQQLLLKNAENGRPVSDAFIYSEDQVHTIQSDQKGMASLKGFESGTVHIQHPSFHEMFVQYTGRDLTVSLKEKIISYDEVVISANKWAQEENVLSQQILSVDRKTIGFQNPQTSADLLAATGQVFMQKSQLGGGSPKLRGFAANSVLLVVDGVRMNNAIFRGGNLQNVINIDPNALQSTEVIFGPGSVIYGSDALGGVMNFQTITPQWSYDDKSDFSANLLARYSSAANERTVHIDFSVAKPRTTFFHSTTLTALDDLRAGSNRAGGYRGAFERNFFAGRQDGEDVLIQNEDPDLQKFSGFQLFNTISKFSTRLGDYADATYGFYFSTTSDIPRYDNLTQTRSRSDALEHAEWYYGPQKWSMHQLRLNLFKSNRFFDQGRLTLAYQSFEESRNDRGFGEDSLRVRTEQVGLYSASLDFEKELNKSNLYYGLDFYSNDVTSTAFRKSLESGDKSPTDSRYPDGGSTYTSLAGYGSFVGRLSGKLFFNGGLRLNYIELKATAETLRMLEDLPSNLHLRNTSFNGSLGLIYNLDKEYKLSYNFSSGFRAPNVDDIGKLFEVGERITVPNPDLRPEYSLSNEISFQLKKDPVYFSAVIFYSRLIDAIVDGPFLLDGQASTVLRGDTLRVAASINTGKANVYGASARLTFELAEHWAFSKTISYTGGKDVNNREPLRHTTPVFGRAAITFQNLPWRAEAYVEYNGSRTTDQIPDSEILDKPYLYTATGTPGWYTLNVKASYTFSKMVSLNLGLENIRDTHYRPYTSGISAPGRNLILALRVQV
ncbi:MAG: TonB-dependent receptor [Bacteroidota bacterium]